MFGKPRKVQQTIEPHKEANKRKSRFQIVKLEERIAPTPCPGCHDNPNGNDAGHGHNGHGRFSGR